MISAVIHGFGLPGRRPGLILLLYVFNLAAALLMVAPLWVFLYQTTGEFMPGSLPGGASWVGDLIMAHWEGMSALSVLAMLVAAGYLVVSQFITMGVFCVAHDPRGPLLATFFGGMGAWFWPMVRLLLLCTPFYICIGLLAWPANRLL